MTHSQQELILREISTCKNVSFRNWEAQVCIYVVININQWRPCKAHSFDLMRYKTAVSGSCKSMNGELKNTEMLSEWKHFFFVQRVVLFWYGPHLAAMLCVESAMPHLQPRCQRGFICISPVDLGCLTTVRRKGISDDHRVLWRNHPAITGHRDGCEHVVTLKVTQAIKVRQRKVSWRLHTGQPIYFYVYNIFLSLCFHSLGQMYVLICWHLTSYHDCPNVCFLEVMQNPCCFCLQLVLHDNQTQEVHIGLYVIPSSEGKQPQ